MRALNELTDQRVDIVHWWFPPLALGGCAYHGRDRYTPGAIFQGRPPRSARPKQHVSVRTRLLLQMTNKLKDSRLLAVLLCGPAFGQWLS